MRGVSEADIAAYLYLQPHVDVPALIEIEHAQVPVDYFQQLNQTVRAARVYQHAVIAQLGVMAYPDLVGEMADLLLRLDGMRWSFCMGQYNGALILSVRTRDRQGGAGRLARAIIGAIGDVDAYQLPDAKGYTSMLRYLAGDTDEIRQRIREEILGSTAADFRAFADTLDQVADRGLVVVLGSQAAIEAANAAKPGWLDVSKVL